MLKRFLKDRLNIIKVLCIAILAVMVFRLADLQIVKGDYYWKMSETIRTRNIPITAPRGKIVDKFGRVVADNKQSYSVIMLKADITEEKLNDIALSISNILERNGDKYKDEIPILLNPIRFTYSDAERDWKKKYNIPDNATAKEAFIKLREEYEIPSDTIDTDAYSILTEQHELELPFTVDDYVFSFTKEEIKWKTKNGFDKSATAFDVLNGLMSKYKIPYEKYGYDGGRKVLAIKYQIKKNEYRAYEPVEIALNVSEQTRAQIEENKIFLDGVEIMEKPLRKYPNGDFAAHVVGYMGRIWSDLEELKKNGYNPSDLVGQSGIEYSMEKYLKGTDGIKQIEVNVKGALMNTVDVSNPVPGNTVFLTIDSRLQKIAEQVLVDTTNKVTVKNGSAAVVAIDVNSGAILAMASEPKFDPSLFASGIRTEDWEALQPKSEDRYAPKPLINNAISYPLPPGSTMKMLTGLAGLTEGVISPYENVYCTGRYTKIPKVSPRDAHGAVHGAQNTVAAIMNSCNYYFFEVGRRLGGEQFENYAKKLGFGQYTGIELPFEAKGSIQGPEYKKLKHKGYLDRYLIYNHNITDKKIREEICQFIYSSPTTSDIRAKLDSLNVKDNTYLADKIYGYIEKRINEPGKSEAYKKELYNYLSKKLKVKDEKTINQICSYVDDNLTREEIRVKLDKLNIKDNTNIVNKIQFYIRESKWNPGDVLNSAIGQGDNNVTPLQLANYVATIVNGGNRYKPHLVEKIISSDGKLVLENKPEIAEKIDISPTNLETLKRGMYNVINGSGTARGLFAGTTIQAGGKTGTAQAGKYRPDPKNKPNYYVEYRDHSWFVAFAPYDKPQIAVAAVVFQGGYGSGAAPIAREIITQYLTPVEVKDSIMQQNDIMP